MHSVLSVLLKNGCQFETDKPGFLLDMWLSGEAGGH